MTPALTDWRRLEGWVLDRVYLNWRLIGWDDDPEWMSPLSEGASAHITGPVHAEAYDR